MEEEIIQPIDRELLKSELDTREATANDQQES